MAQDKTAPTREERLAAKLRENLRRRKAQGRAKGEAPGRAPADGQCDPGEEATGAALPKRGEDG